MNAKAGCIGVVAIAVILALGASAEAQLPKQGKYRGMFGVQGAGTVHELDKDHVFFVGEFSGVFFNDVANGFMDKTSVVCPGVNDIAKGVSLANHGYCIVTDKDGDKAYLVWKGEGTGPNVGGGDSQWMGGTGKFAGIKGGHTYQYNGIADTPRYWVVWAGEYRME